MAAPTSSIQRVQENRFPAGNQRVIRAEKDIAAPAWADTIAEANTSLNVVKAAAQPWIETQGEKLATDVVEDVERGIASLTTDADAAVATAQEAGPIRPSDEQEARQLAARKGVEALGEKEFRDLKDAMVAGKITQDQANLLVANQIKKRTQEAPMFSRQIRDSAENILGFNATSMQARTLLGVLGTEPRTATLTAEQKVTNKSVAIAQATGGDAEEIKKKIYQVEYAELNSKQAKFSQEQGSIELEDSVGVFVTEMYVKGVLDTTAAISVAQSASPDGLISDTAVLGVVNAQEMQAKAALLEHAGAKNATAPETTAAMASLTKLYEDQRSYYKSVSRENLTDAHLTQLDKFNQIHGLEHFGKQAILNKYLGEAAGVQVRDIQLKYWNQPETMVEMLRHVDGYEDILSFMGKDLGSPFSKKDVVTVNNVMNSALVKKAEGKPLTAEETLLLPVALAQAVALPNGNNNADATEGYFKTLAGNGDVLSASMGAGVVRFDAKPATVAEMKRSYKEDSGKYIDRVALQLSQVGGREELTYFFNKQGELVIKELGSASTFRPLDDAVDNVNIYPTAMSNGWSKDFGTTQEEYQERVLTKIDATLKAADNAEVISRLNHVTSLAIQGKHKEAKVSFNRLRKDKSLDWNEYEAYKDRLSTTEERFTTVPNFDKNLVLSNPAAPVIDLLTDTPNQQSGVLLQDEVFEGSSVFHGRLLEAGMSPERVQFFIDQAFRTKSRVADKKRRDDRVLVGDRYVGDPKPADVRNIAGELGLPPLGE